MPREEGENKQRDKEQNGAASHGIFPLNGRKRNWAGQGCWLRPVFKDKAGPANWSDYTPEPAGGTMVVTKRKRRMSSAVWSQKVRGYLTTGKESVGTGGATSGAPWWRAEEVPPARWPADKGR